MFPVKASRNPLTIATSVAVIIIIAFTLAVSSSLFVLSFSPIPALATEELEPRAVIEDDDNNPSLNSTGSGSDIPLIEKVSDNGTYLVQLAWPQLPLNPDNAFDLQVNFLNASAPRGTNETVPQAETNFTGSGSEAGGTVPSTQQNFLDVDSYDITIYSDDGSVLWQKMDQPGTGGSPGERVLIGNYTGPVTIDITDIRPGGGVGDSTTTAGDVKTDSVEFTATVVPEFPLAMIPLIAAVAGIVVILRIKIGMQNRAGGNGFNAM